MGLDLRNDPPLTFVAARDVWECPLLEVLDVRIEVEKLGPVQGWTVVLRDGAGELIERVRLRHGGFASHRALARMLWRRLFYRGYL